MTGAEHYKRAEYLERLAVEQWERDQPLWQLTIQQAQVNATLALAAATIDAAAFPRATEQHGQIEGYTMHHTDVHESWVGVLV